MKIDSNSLLNTCLEIEGLLCLVSRRGNTVPDNVGQLLVEKASMLKAGLIEFTSDIRTDDEDDEEIAQAVIIEETEDAGETPDSAADAQAENTVNLTPVEEDDTVVEALPEPVAASSDADAVVEPESSVSAASATPVSDAVSAPVVRNDVAPVELTINDKFRFRRELFGNSDVDLAEALQIASQMSSVEEIEDYFYNDLCFDPANDTVKDFIRVLTSKR